MKLSDAKIRAAKTKEKSYKLSDGERLQLLIHSNGSKYWQFSYKFAEKERVLSLGSYPRISLAKAREEKQKAQQLLRDFIDPCAQRKQQKQLAIYKDRNSFVAVAEEWRQRNANTWTEKYNNRTWARLQNHVFPSLGRRPISEITPLEILATIQVIEKKGMTEMSHRVLWLCSSIFRFGIVTGRLQINPAIGLTDGLQRHVPSHYPTLGKTELPSFLQKLAFVEATDQNKIALSLLMHTALRTGELRQSRWEFIDYENRELVIPAELMKMRKIHVVPLSGAVMNLLCELKQHSGHSEWLFPNRHGSKHPVMSENTINALIARMGYKGRLVGHGFRSMFSTALNENGFNRDAIERQLAHSEPNAVRAAYNRAEYMEERRRLMEWWSDYLNACQPKLLT